LVSSATATEPIGIVLYVAIMPLFVQLHFGDTLWMWTSLILLAKERPDSTTKKITKDSSNHLKWISDWTFHFYYFADEGVDYLKYMYYT